MRIADPTALAALMMPELPLERAADSLCWLPLLRTLFYGNVPLSVLGRWFGVHKTAILRWVVRLALAVWPLTRLRAGASEVGITPWSNRVEAKLPGLICSVGSVRLPSTTNAIERFLRAFQRIYATHGAFTRSSVPNGS